MDEFRDEKRCYFHPREVVIGVCALCLNERLVILAEKQGGGGGGRLRGSKTNGHAAAHGRSISMHKVFALGSLLHRLDIRHHKSDVVCDTTTASTSREDSFISINFEDNGKTSWEKRTIGKIPLDPCDMAWNHSKCNKEEEEEAHHPSQGLKSVVEHPKPRGSLRWRTRIGHLFHLVRWKRSSGSKGNVCHVGSKLEGVVKVRHGWIRSLTKRRTSKE